MILALHKMPCSEVHSWLPKLLFLFLNSLHLLMDEVCAIIKWQLIQSICVWAHNFGALDARLAADHRLHWLSIVVRRRFVCRLLQMTKYSTLAV